MDALATVKSQIESAKVDLEACKPTTLDWISRSIQTAETIIPWLIVTAPGMKNYVEDILNAPAILRSMWNKMRTHVILPTDQIDAFDRQLTLDDVLRESVTGEVVSNVVTRYLKEHHPEKILLSNGRSDYPDIYLSTQDYSVLPQFKRHKNVIEADAYGAAVKATSRLAINQQWLWPGRWFLRRWCKWF